MKTVQIIVKGKVQGVYFRQSAKEKAVSLNLTGTVQNSPDGNVQIIVSGNPEQIKLFINWCRVGPPRAIVTNIIKEDVSAQLFTDFRIIRF